MLSNELIQERMNREPKGWKRLRMSFVMMKQAGATVDEIAYQLMIHEATVYRWNTIFLTRGLEGLMIRGGSYVIRDILAEDLIELSIQKKNSQKAIIALDQIKHIHRRGKVIPLEAKRDVVKYTVRGSFTRMEQIQNWLKGAYGVVANAATIKRTFGGLFTSKAA